MAKVFFSCEACCFCIVDGPYGGVDASIANLRITANGPECSGVVHKVSR